MKYEVVQVPDLPRILAQFRLVLVTDFSPAVMRDGDGHVTRLDVLKRTELHIDRVNRPDFTVI